MTPASPAGTAPDSRSAASGTARLLCALAYGSGLALADRMEHGTNTAYLAVKLGKATGLGPDGLEAVFYGALIKDVGCGACSALISPFFPDGELAPRLDMLLVDLYNPRDLLTWAKGQLHFDATLPTRLARLAAFAARCGPVAHEAMRAHCEIASDFAVGLGFRPHVQEAVHYQYERFDGRSLAFGKRAETIPQSAQVLHLAQAAEVARALAGPDATARMIRKRAGSYFDPRLAEAYLDTAGELWPPGDDPLPLPDVLAADPGTMVDQLPGDRRLAVCEALADFVDLKSARSFPHSHTVAAMAATVAAQIGLDRPEQERLRRAGLVHDLGKIAVPRRLLEHAEDHISAPGHAGGTASLAEPVRLHPYYAQRILSRVEPLADLAADVSAHHERLDGTGYPAGVSGHGVSIGARVLAAADAWAEQTRGGPVDLTADEGLDRACTAAIRTTTIPGSLRRRRPPQAEAPISSLSPREIEVLRLVVQGASNPDISKALYISRRTAEHHVEHILVKLGVTSRTGAAAYALTHQLLP